MCCAVPMICIMISSKATNNKTRNRCDTYIQRQRQQHNWYHLSLKSRKNCLSKQKKFLDPRAIINDETDNSWNVYISSVADWSGLVTSRFSLSLSFFLSAHLRRRIPVRQVIRYTIDTLVGKEVDRRRLFPNHMYSINNSTTDPSMDDVAEDRTWFLIPLFPR